MTAREHEAQEIVSDVVVDRGVEVRHRELCWQLDLVTDLVVLALEPLVPAQDVERAILRGGDEPGARVLRDADSGDCSSATTSASCASSSATPTSRTIRARPAINLGDSIRKTASMARCVADAVTASD